MEINYIHIDITDGHFVPMISFGANTVKDLRKHTDFVLDCHLMVENPENLIPVIVGAGADIITVHTEATKHIYRSIQTIKSVEKSRNCDQSRNSGIYDQGDFANG